MVATTTRVGVDIVGTDRTRAAFTSAQAGLARFNRSISQFKGLMAGFAGGNLLAGFTRSMVSINKEVPAVKTAIDQLNGAWTLFGKKVGEAGLNDALINFSQRIGALVSGGDSLSRSIGAFMAGAVNSMAGVFEAIARSIAFVYDNLAAFGRLLANVGLLLFGRHLIIVAGNFLLFARTIGATGKAMAAFIAIKRMGMAGFIVLAGVIGYATNSLDDMRAAIDAVWQKAKEVFPEMGRVSAGILQDLGFDTSAWTADLNQQIAALDGLGAVAPPVTQKLKALGMGAKGAGQGMSDFGASVAPVNDSLQQMGQSFGSEFSSAFNSIIDGSKNAKEAFADMAKSMLNNAASMFANKLFSGIFGGLFGGGMGGGLPAGVLSAAFGGPKAKGGPVSSGKSYMVGENGPELFMPGQSGSIIPNGAGARPAVNMSITINAPNSDKAAIAVLGAKVEKMASSLHRTVKQVVSAEYNLNPRFVN